MARAREVTKFYTGHRGYAVLPRPDVLRADDVLAWAENVWMSNGAGICVRRGGLVNVSLHADMVSSAGTLYGCLTYPAAPGVVGAFAGGANLLTTWFVTTVLRTTSLWSVLTVPTAVRTNHPYSLLPDTTFPAQCATVNSKVVFCTTKWCGTHTRLALYDMDAATLRLAGYGTPAAPTGADGGSGSYAATLRYYRVRYTTQASSVTTRRSEPSAALTFTPSGSGTHVTVTKPAALSEGETHWELEVSLDNANWYRLATTAVATTTYNDSAATSSYSGGTLSEDVGARLPPGQCRSVIADRDRFLFGGQWWQWATVPATARALSNRVWFTPVLGTTDVADEECVPTDNYIDVAATTEDHITALWNGPHDDILVFKERAIYRLLRTGIRAAPYEVADGVFSGVGVLGPQYVCSGLDADSNACIYFADRTGYWRYGLNGLTRLNGPLDTGHVVPEYRVVFHRSRRTVLFGRLAYHIDTGAWSLMTWSDVLHEQQVGSPHWSTETVDTAGDQLWAPGRGTAKVRLLDAAASAKDLTTLNADTSFVARVGVSRRMLAPGAKWGPTRCVLWGGGGATLDVSVARAADPVTDFDTVDETLLEAVGSVVLPTTRASASVSPAGLGVGVVSALGVWLSDASDTAWQLDALELSGVPAEPLP